MIFPSPVNTSPSPSFASVPRHWAYLWGPVLKGAVEDGGGELRVGGARVGRSAVPDGRQVEPVEVSVDWHPPPVRVGVMEADLMAAAKAGGGTSRASQSPLEHTCSADAAPGVIHDPKGGKKQRRRIPGSSTVGPVTVPRAQE